MISTDDHATTFLASVFDPPRDDFFQGYCFSGPDLIFGDSGAKNYSASTGRAIVGGLDGRYVQVSRENNAYIFDNDFAGYEALYYYHDGTIWVVSNSFAQIVQFLRRNKLPVTPNYTHLSSITHRRMPAQQLFAFATIVRGIHVAPPAYSLVITPNQALLNHRGRAGTDNGNYKEALTAHINLWVSRFETLMVDRTADFTTELTGGVDSRANLALLVAARNRLGNSGDQPRIVSNTGARYEADLRIAQTLATHYGLKLNDNRRVQTYPLSARERYETFKDLSLGVYYPLYFPVKGPTPTDIAVSGGGGGIHRKIYENIHKTNDVNKLIRTYANKAGHPEYVFEFTRDANHMLDLILEPGEDPLRALLRDGRVRYHTGRAARFAMSFAPLHSVSANAAQVNAGETRLEDGQFNYDIMFSVDQELIDMPYDEPSKAPSASVRRNLTSALVDDISSPGKVWRGDLDLDRQLDPNDVKISSLLQRDLEKAYRNPFVTTFWSKALADEARELMATLSAGQSIGNAVNGIPIHALLAADLASPS